MRRRMLGGAVIAALVGLVATLMVPTARAESNDREVAPGIVLRTFTRVEPGVGPQEVRVLRFRLDDAHVHLRPLLAADYGARLVTVPDLVLDSGALAAVNSDFFTNNGNVRGIVLQNGVLRSEPEPALPGAATPRAAWRVQGNDVAFGRPGSSLSWTRTSDGTLFGINGIERAPGYLTNPDEAVVDTTEFGPVTATPPDGVDAVVGALPPIKPNTPLAAAVTDVRTGPGPIPSGGAVVSATGRNATQLRDFGVARGDQFTIRVDIDDPDFATAAWAGGGGPWIVHNGQGIAREVMQAEAFSLRHINEVVPRTAIGRTADGTILLLTVDGRQPGRSVGAELGSLSRILLELGAVDAIALDGGSSTTMSVDGLTLNHPSAGAPIGVGDAVGVFYDWQPVATRRIAGADRIATAIEVSKERKSANAVVLATSTGFADALVGGPLAASLGGPVLLTGPAGLDGRVTQEIKRLGATRAVLLGGPNALSAQVQADLATIGVTSIQRLAGADRYATAAAVAGAVGRSDVVLVASGETFPDALAAGALGLPVLLTLHDSLPDVTRAAIGDSSAVVVGGPVAVGNGVVPGATRVAGADRYGTSAAVADWGFTHSRVEPSRVVIARGDDYPDALVAGALRHPVLLVGRFGLDDSPATRDWLRDHGALIATAALLGGRLGLSTMDQIQVEDAIAPGTTVPTVVGDLGP